LLRRKQLTLPFVRHNVKQKTTVARKGRREFPPAAPTLAPQTCCFPFLRVFRDLRFGRFPRQAALQLFVISFSLSRGPQRTRQAAAVLAAIANSDQFPSEKPE
jgi:hypothetical protein